MTCKIFDRSKLVPCKNSLIESVKICWDHTKNGLVLPINFYRTRIKEPVIITRIKSCSNLLIFLFVFFVLFRADLAHLVLSLLAVVPAILSQIISACSMSIVKYIIYTWNLLLSLMFFNGRWTFGESNNIKSFQIWWISETKRVVSTLCLWSSISSPQIGKVRRDVGREYL